MKIKQAKTSMALSEHKNNLLSNYCLEEYTSTHRPAIFFGCYPGALGNISDAASVRLHKSIGIIVWFGGDIRKFKDRLLSGSKQHKARSFLDFLLTNRKRIKHIAISDFIHNDLCEMGLKPIDLLIAPAICNKFAPVPLGDEVYVYSSESDPFLYGFDIVKKLKSRLKDISFRICKNRSSNNYDSMSSVYSKCFIGLRPTRHDGLSNTVIELGLMGRKCIWNGGRLSNSVPFKTINDIELSIKKEQENIGQINKILSDKVRDEMQFNSNWFEKSWYNG